jgi:hypothetical protein
LVRIAAVLLTGAFCAVPHFAQGGSSDAAFAKVPFDEWLQAGNQTNIRWSMHVSRPQLSNHQRLSSLVEAQVDGRDLASRRGRGEMAIFIQITDREGNVYQTHGAIDLEKMEEGVRSQDVTYSQSVFVLPGEYRVAVALFDTASREHTARQENWVVPPMKNDPLPEAWKDLPAVEFATSADPPEGWFLPGERGRLHLQVAAERPLQVEVLLNLTGSEIAPTTRLPQSKDPGTLLAALKTVAAIDVRNSSLNVALLDLTRRRVAFAQKNVRELEWPGIKDALTQSESGIIDVKTLKDSHRDAAFFVSEVRRRLGGPESHRVLIVLSSPIAFESGEDLQPINAGRSPGCQVFYLRFHPRLPAAMPVVTQPGRGRAGRFGMPPRAIAAPQIDQLANTLKPLSPRVFDIDRPDQFRKALATILSEIARM